MKRFIILFVLLLIILLKAGMSQPQPGENGDGTDVGGEPVEGAAPLGSGLVILTLLAVTYGGKKVYDYRKKGEQK